MNLFNEKQLKNNGCKSCIEKHLMIKLLIEVMEIFHMILMKMIFMLRMKLVFMTNLIVLVYVDLLSTIH